MRHCIPVPSCSRRGRIDIIRDAIYTSTPTVSPAHLRVTHRPQQLRSTLSPTAPDFASILPSTVILHSEHLLAASVNPCVLVPILCFWIQVLWRWPQIPFDFDIRDDAEEVTHDSVVARGIHAVHRQLRRLCETAFQFL